MANKFVIEVRAKGFSNLQTQLLKSDEALKKFDNSVKRGRRSTTGFERGMGALRNTFLLYAFAMGVATKATSSFIRNASRFQFLRTRLVGLTGSVVKANQAFENFNSVAATTPFTLDDVVNAGAQLQAFGADANALIKPITDLAAFMGTTATEAANSFGRAFAGGAGAADILRERGILNIIKTSQGLSDLSNTTLPKFREALINTLQDPVIGIEGSTDRLSRTFTGAFSNMQDSVTRFTAEVGDKALPKLTSLTRATTSFFNEITSGFRRAFGTEAANMLENLKALNVEASLLKDLQILVFQEETQKQVAKVNEEIGKLLAKNKRLRDTFLEFGTGDVNVKRLQKTTIALSETFDNVSISTDKAKDLIQNLKQQLNLTRINAKELAEEFNNTGNISESASAKLSNQSVALLSLIAALQQTVNLSEDLKNKIAEFSVNSEQVTATFTKFEEVLKNLDENGKFAFRTFSRFGDAFAEAALTATTFEEAAKKAIRSVAAEIISKAATFALMKMFFCATA